MMNEVVLEGIVVKTWKYADGLLFRLVCLNQFCFDLDHGVGDRTGTIFYARAEIAKAHRSAKSWREAPRFRLV